MRQPSSNANRQRLQLGQAKVVQLASVTPVQLVDQRAPCAKLQNNPHRFGTHTVEGHDVVVRRNLRQAFALVHQLLDCFVADALHLLDRHSLVTPLPLVHEAKRSLTNLGIAYQFVAGNEHLAPEKRVGCPCYHCVRTRHIVVLSFPTTLRRLERLVVARRHERSKRASCTCRLGKSRRLVRLVAHLDLAGTFCSSRPSS
mmetsp:Transcript_10240/g.32489  ORF Transcript_10240/g.32489 Transcript_10240/m.32489 type:complete len:200 (-) Transcript_10240:1018-1617(-)